ncbi:MAG TPA: ribosome-associated translation inhibitor RaiA [Phycisphaerales bacterium]|nr:ribosome-associated translation inhibitor RaiA [Phycisphaerales bacterium]
MRVEVIGKHMDVTDAIRTYALSKADKLTKFLDMTQLIQVVLEAHKKGEFAAEVVVDVEHHDDFVAHAKAADLYAAIDLAVDKAARQLTDFKERLKTNKR